jgi:hypothetical protein
MNLSHSDSSGDCPAFQVQPYSLEKLTELICEKSLAPAHVVANKCHIPYFRNYFSALGAKSIVIENGYVDRDYLDDFAGYYVRCFTDYGKICTRFHFFNQELTTDYIDRVLLGEKDIDEAVREGYLGFVVIKPLPRTVIGRTCLKTYPDDHGRRQFPITRTYECNLFGIDFQVQTLAFQEQDNVVAACATSALWSIFQGTGRQYQHPIPSPFEITRTAAVNISSESRAIPNNGLTANQLAHAIRTVGLEPFKVSAKNHFVLRSTLYAYLRAKIPIFLGFDLVDNSPNGPLIMGKHGVAITGFSLGADEPIPIEGFCLRASRIDKIYVHDDQIGPFARMVFDGFDLSFLNQDGSNSTIPTLSTSWIGSSGTEGTVRAVTEILIIPLYHKIRIPFSTVQDLVISFDQFVRSLKALTGISELEWDIFLTTVSDLKSDLLKSGSFKSNKYRREVLLDRMSRFVWRARASCDGECVLELLFDATDIQQGSMLIRAIENHPALSAVLRAIPESAAEYLQNQRFWSVLMWFKDRELPF